MAGVERLDRCVVVVERVGPNAERRHRKTAKAAGAGRCDSDRVKGGGAVHIGHFERAGRCGCAGDGIGHAAGFNHGAPVGTADDGCIVAAVDRYRNGLGCAIKRIDLEGIRQRLAIVESLHACVRIVEGVGPDPSCRHCEVPKTAGACFGGQHCRKGIGRVVHIGVGQRAGCRSRSGDCVGDATRFDHIARASAPDDGGIVAALDRYPD